MTLPAPYWQSKNGRHVIYCAQAESVLPALPDSSVDFIWTDPPYGHNNNNGDLIARREAALGKKAVAETEWRPIANDGAEANGLVRWFFVESNRLLKPGCCCCCCGGGGGPDPQFARWSLWIDDAIGFKMCVVWDKGGLGMGWHYRRNWECVLVAQKKGAACRWYGGNDVPNVVRINKIIPQKSDHPTVKPVALPAWFLRLHTRPNDLVLDPFCGHGSGGVAAIRAGCRFIGCELDKGFASAAAERMERELAQPMLPTLTPETAMQENLPIRA